MRLGLYLAVVVASLSSPGFAHADELMRLCGPHGVGFIRTSRGQTCLYSPEAKSAPPGQSSQPGQPSPQTNSGSPSQPAASGKP